MAGLASVRKFFGGAFGFDPGPKAPVTRTVGVGETQSWGGYVVGRDTNAEWADPRRRARKMDEAVRNVEIIGSAVMMTYRIMSGVEWTFSAPDDLQGANENEAEERCTQTKSILNDMTTPWPKVVAKHGLYPFFGAAIAEWTAKRRADGVMGFKDIEHRGLATIRRWNIDDSGTVQGVEQVSPFDNIPHYIERGRMVYSVIDAISDAPDGVSLLRMCAEAVRTLQEYMRIEGSGFANDLRGIPVSYAPLSELESLIGTTVNGRKYTKADMKRHLKGLNAFMRNHVRNGELSLELDSDVYRDLIGNPTGAQKYKVEVLRGDGGPQESMAAAIQRLIYQIATVLGVEHMLVGSGDTGSFALSSEKILMYKLLVDTTLAEMAATFRRDILTPLFEMNGWDVRCMPVMKPEVVALRSVTDALDVVVRTATAAANDPAVDILRERVGLPPRPEPDLSLMGPLVPGGVPVPGQPGAPVPPGGSDPPKDDLEDGGAPADATGVPGSESAPDIAPAGIAAKLRKMRPRERRAWIGDLMRLVA